MTLQKVVNMTRPTALYLTLAAVLVLAVFVEGRMGLTLLVTGTRVPFQQPIAAGLFGLSVAFGLLGAQRHSARTLDPWKVPQSQALLCFIAFFIFGAAAVLLSS